MSPSSPSALIKADAARSRIVRPGHNCWRVERADRMRCIQDAAEYFRLVRRAMLSAEHTIFTLGWDTSAHTELLPGETPSDGPARLDQLLAWIARRRPELRCYVLTWDYGLLHLFERDPLTRWRLGWRMPSNVTFAFDDHHALGGCHHQKVVVVDDRLAFAGGIDLTGHRWDTAEHRVEEPRRVSLDGDLYQPYHEVGAMVSGPVAAALGEMARQRWHAAAGIPLPEVRPSDVDLWPTDIVPDVRNAAVAIARTLPPLDDQAGVAECEALYLDSIAAARESIYIESQYFTDDRIARALAARLAEPDGPEIIVVMPECCEGWVEQTTMGALRDRVGRGLIEADVHGRLRIVYPSASQSRKVPIFVHSKVMFVDDRLARIGSANLSKRSMGVDSECDVAVDATGDDDAAASVLQMRNRLIAEHLAMSVEDVTREMAAHGSIRAVIDARSNADRTLVRLHVPEKAEMPSEALVAAADPRAPIHVEAAVDAAIAGPAAFARDHPRRVITVLSLAGLALGASAAAWQLSRGREGRRRLLHAGNMLALAALGAGAFGAWRSSRNAARIVSRHRKGAEFG
jgi:phosphatidylserine/phosphatidylglycerophosphate/cardiolipin synthase-like enzyme